MNRSKILHSISWLLFDKGISIIGTLVVGIWLARYLGPSDYGVFNYAIAYTVLFSFFIRLGLDEIVVREAVKSARMAPYYFGTAFVIKLIGAIIAMTSIFVSLQFMVTDDLTKLVIMVFSIGFIFSPFDVIDFFYRSIIVSKYAVIARNCAFIISSSISVYFIIYEYDVIFFAYSSILNAILASVFLVVSYIKTGNSFSKWKYSPKIAKRLIMYCWPLAISIFLISIHLRVDQIMIGNMLSSEQVGLYSISVKLSEFWLFIPGIIISTLMPYFVNLREKDDEMYGLRLMQLYSIMIWLSVSVGVVTIIFGREFIDILFGEAYFESYNSLVINIWTGLFMSLGMARGIWLISENLQIYRLYSNVIVVLLNIAANLILIPKFGIAGAALATLLTQSFGFWVLSFLWKPLRSSTWATIKAINPMYLIVSRSNV